MTDTPQTPSERLDRVERILIALANSQLELQTTQWQMQANQQEFQLNQRELQAAQSGTVNSWSNCAPIVTTSTTETGAACGRPSETYSI